MAARIVLPGDVVGLPEAMTQARVVRIGPGLRQEEAAEAGGSGSGSRSNGAAAMEEGEASAAVVAAKAGVVQQARNSIWIETSQRRYVPAHNERVLGVIASRVGDAYAVDIGTHLNATLSSLAFEGATKRNRPNLQIGDLVYARLTVANKDMEPEIECIDGTTGKSTGLGQLTGGYMIECGLDTCRRLLRPNCALLQQLGSRVKFELAVGLNGRVWVDAGNVDDTILVANAIKASQNMSPRQVEAMVRTLLQRRR